MYGSAVFIALKGRATQIEEKTWRDGSAKCLIPIALKAGVVTWGVIVVATVIDQFPQGLAVADRNGARAQVVRQRGTRRCNDREDGGFLADQDHNRIPLDAGRRNRKRRPCDLAQWRRAPHRPAPSGFVKH